MSVLFVCNFKTAIVLIAVLAHGLAPAAALNLVAVRPGNLDAVSIAQICCGCASLALVVCTVAPAAAFGERSSIIAMILLIAGPS